MLHRCLPKSFSPARLVNHTSSHEGLSPPSGAKSDNSAGKTTALPSQGNGESAGFGVDSLEGPDVHGSGPVAVGGGGTDTRGGNSKIDVAEDGSWTEAAAAVEKRSHEKEPVCGTNNGSAVTGSTSVERGRGQFKDEKAAGSAGSSGTVARGGLNVDPEALDAATTEDVVVVSPLTRGGPPILSTDDGMLYSSKERFERRGAHSLSPGMQGQSSLSSTAAIDLTHTGGVRLRDEFDDARTIALLAAALRLQRLLYGLARLHLRALGESQTRILMGGLSAGLGYARAFHAQDSLRMSLFSAG